MPKGAPGSREAAVLQLLEGAERASGRQLGWAALLLVQLLCWMRADSCAGFQDDDIIISHDGRVSVSVRYMKNRKEFVAQPGLIEIAAPKSQVGLLFSFGEWDAGPKLGGTQAPTAGRRPGLNSCCMACDLSWDTLEYP